MLDGMEALFTGALGLTPPWQVSSVRFAPEEHAIHFDVICAATRLPCPQCAAPDQPIHDRLKRDWQHLHFFQYRAFIHAEVPRVRCAVCADKGDGEVRQVAVPWSRERSGFSLLFEAMVVTLAGMSRMPVRQIGALLGVNDARLWRSLGALVDVAYAKADMRGVKAIGIDEKNIGRGRVVTVVHEGSAANKGRVLHLSEGCKAQNVGLFVEALQAHGGDPSMIDRCSMDMAKSYIVGVAQHLPNASHCFDPFHLIKLANEAVNTVRRSEVATEPLLKRTRAHWLKDAQNWTPKEVGLHHLRHSQLKTARAWRIKERLRDIVAWRRCPHVPVTLLMDQWISWARRSRLTPFKRLAQTFQAHLHGIRNTLTYANSNATAESINADIQSSIARARGFRTFRNLRTIVYLLKGKLELPRSPFKTSLA